MMQKKSQLSISDLFLAVSIFVVMLGAVVFLYSHYTAKFESRQEFNRMQLTALSATELMVKSEGNPLNWENNISKTTIIGLAGSPRSISQAKLEAFMNMSYAKSKKVLGTDDDYYFMLAYLDGTMIAEKGLNATGEKAVGIQRMARYNDDDVMLTFVLWE